MEITVRGHQFGWDYTYPEGFTVDQEGTLSGDVTPLVVPTHKLVRLVFEGTDVIHSWWVPAISGKTDAVPGYSQLFVAEDRRARNLARRVRGAVRAQATAPCRSSSWRWTSPSTTSG